MEKLELGDKVYRFINGRYYSGIYKVVEVGTDYYGIIPTDCKINGVEPTVENTNKEIYPLDCEVFAIGIGTLSIHKATPELVEKVDKFNTRMMVIDKICEELKICDRNFKAVKDVLLKKSTKQLFAIFFILITEADGKRGICSINKDGHLENDFFIPEELINEVREPKE